MDPSNIDDGAILSDLREQMKRLESRLMSIEKGSVNGDTSRFTDPDDTFYRAQGEDGELPPHVGYFPKVRKCNFMEFKNRFCDNDARFAVDVLVSGDTFEQEYLEEQRLREKLFEREKTDPRTARRKFYSRVKLVEKSNDVLRNDQSGGTWIRRIRIQAPALLKILAKVQGEIWSNIPRTYDRPFCTLIHFQPKVKEALAELEDKWATDSDAERLDSPVSSTIPAENEYEEDTLDDSRVTLETLRAYVEFMDTEILPETRRFDNLRYPFEDKILFSDLCYLFKPGDFIYRLLDGEQTGDGVDHRMGERIWRAFFVEEPLRDLNRQDREWSEDGRSCFALHAYHIEFSGDEFCVVPNVFKIAPYEGLQPLNKLPFHPIRIDDMGKSPLSSSMGIGDQVLEILDAKHAFYNDWTVTRQPTGEFTTDADGAEVKYPEYINSDVMVDFKEAFNACPEWMPQRTVLKPESFNKTSTTDEFAIRWWLSTSRAKIRKETREMIPQCTGVHHMQRNKFVLEDKFLVNVAQNCQKEQPTTKEYLRWEEKVLIFCRVYAYVFGERKFAQLDVSRLTPSARNYDALDALKIPTKTKKMIQGSVRGHFLQKNREGGKGGEGRSLDVIQGKGCGLFILLHGVPGVGKTATAEAIAQANGKPLFKITCGDIGLTPDQVETSLRAIFRLASIWDCILLMDEVDTFFSQRSKGDSSITKNALVSVFLRVLDYYNGILFLTTNRSGALDEAFKSRIHYKIYYPPLDKNQAMLIWQLNLERLHKISESSNEKWPLKILDNVIIQFAEAQFNANATKKTGQWNGRQIRNAFQVARSLAYFDALYETDQAAAESGEVGLMKPAVLDTTYFEMMHEMTESFDKYMLTVFNGQNDGDLALEMEHRADHFRYREVRDSREDDNFRYREQNSAVSPLKMGVRRDYADQSGSFSHTGGPLSLTSPENISHCYSSRSLGPIHASGYDDNGVDERGPGLGLKRAAQPMERTTRDFFGAPRSEKDYSFGQRPYSGPTHSLGQGSQAPESWMYTRSDEPFAHARESRRPSELDIKQSYRDERNGFGKREREEL